jgi:hypothetical protein
MIFTNAQYDISGHVTATVDGMVMTIPLDPANRHYAALIEAGVEIADAAEPSIEQIRAGTSIDRAAFCNGLADAGVITDEEAISAARGDWPASFAGFLTATIGDGAGHEIPMFTAAQQRAIQITWAACVTVQRNHEFVLSLAWWTSMADVQVDALFGIKI